MFEDRSEKQLIVIYVFISLLVTLGFSAFNLSPLSSIRNQPILVVVIANVLFFCFFYILYLPVKVRKAREKEEKSKKNK